MNNIIVNYIKSLSDNKQVQKISVEILGNIFLKQDNFDLFIKENNDKIIHIKDWISSIVQNNEEWRKPRVLTLDALNNLADKYFEKKNNQLKTIELNKKDEKLIADLGNYYVVQMLTPEALDNESKVMQHCIGHGGYDGQLNNSKYKYLSLRDRFNKAHVTLEIYRNEIFQLQGKQNKLPEYKYLEKLLPWLIKNGYKIKLEKYKLVINKNDNKIYSMFDLPENCEIDGNLDLKHEVVNKLPNNLTVNENVNLICCVIKELPNNLFIKGNLDLSSSTINKLSDNLIVNQLDLSGCHNLSKLSDNLFVNSDLNLSWCDSLKELSNNIVLNGSLNLAHSGIEILPDNLTVNGDLNLENCINLKKLPKGLVVKGDLCLNYTNFNEIPEDINIENNLDLSCSKIIKLPHNLKIGGNLKFFYSAIEELPDNLTCKDIFIKKDQIYLIKETMNIKVFIVDFKSIQRKDFFKKMKQNKFNL